MEKSPRKFEGRQVLFPAHTNRNWGFSATADGGNVAAAGNEQSVDFKIKETYVYGRVAFTGGVLEASATKKGAFIEDSKFQMKGLVNTARFFVNTYTWGSGVGTLAKFTGNDTLTSTATTTAFTLVDNTRLLRANMKVDIVSGGVVKNTAVINSVDSVTGFTIAAVTVGVAYAPINGDLIVNSGDYNIVPMGMSGLVDDGGILGTLQSASRTTYPALKSVVLGNSGTLRNLTMDLAQQCWDTIVDNGGVEPEEMWAHTSLRRELLSLAYGDVRFEPEKFMTGVKVLTFNGVPVIVDRACPLNKAFFINWKQFKKYVKFDFKWIDRDGLIIRLAGVGTSLADSWEAFYGAGINFGVEGPALGNGRLDDINATIPAFVLNN